MPGRRGRETSTRRAGSAHGCDSSSAGLTDRRSRVFDRTPVITALVGPRLAGCTKTRQPISLSRKVIEPVYREQRALRHSTQPSTDVGQLQAARPAVVGQPTTSLDWQALVASGGSLRRRMPAIGGETVRANRPIGRLVSGESRLAPGMLVEHRGDDVHEFG